MSNGVAGAEFFKPDVAPLQVGQCLPVAEVIHSDGALVLPGNVMVTSWIRARRSRDILLLAYPHLEREIVDDLTLLVDVNQYLMTRVDDTPNKNIERVPHWRSASDQELHERARSLNAQIESTRPHRELWVALHERGYGIQPAAAVVLERFAVADTGEGHKAITAVVSGWDGHVGTVPEQYRPGGLYVGPNTAS